MSRASFARGILMDRGWGALGFCAKPQVYTYVTDSAPSEGRRKQGRIYAHLNEPKGTVAFEVTGKNTFQKHEAAYILSKCAEFYNVVKEYGWRLE